MWRSRKNNFLPVDRPVSGRAAPTQTSETSSRSQGGGSFMVWSSSSTASAQTRDRALQSANTYETSRCQLL